MMIGSGFVFGFIMEGMDELSAVFVGLVTFWFLYVVIHFAWSSILRNSVNNIPTSNVNQQPTIPTINVSQLTTVSNLPSPNPPKTNMAGDFVVYHGSSDSNQARRIIREGLKPGSGNAYGTGIYMAENFDDAKEHATKGGTVFELHIDGNTPYKIYEDLPGNTPEDKWFFSSGGLFQPLVWIKSQRWFVCYGSTGQPVQIPGLMRVLVKDYWGNDINI